MLQNKLMLLFIELIKSDSENFYNVTKDFCSKYIYIKSKNPEINYIPVSTKNMKHLYMNIWNYYQHW